MKVTELAKILSLSVGVRYIGWLPEPLWQAKLEPGLQYREVRFQDNSSSSSNIKVIGDGTTPEEALNSLAKGLVGKTILMRPIVCDSEVEFLVSDNLSEGY